MYSGFKGCLTLVTLVVCPVHHLYANSSTLLFIFLAEVYFTGSTWEALTHPFCRP
ncbi:hypothetical protein M758_3G015000 [Ceratodon purpureus]|uniref:Uncharacterized protein n=1 Tax=Ceratodon purpureus TaxID=3225 RepID=A0A8T0IG35_CERPU|nr:hypothetical protein KC19_3G014900 [Ceratodon purpureus]KAG0621377.1 hypothetical protein M758_3G015000 [Ceratodon purpureus]